MYIVLVRGTKQNIHVATKIEEERNKEAAPVKRAEGTREREAKKAHKCSLGRYYYGTFVLCQVQYYVQVQVHST